jgi:hypothetical protein
MGVRRMHPDEPEQEGSDFGLEFGTIMPPCADHKAEQKQVNVDT